MARSPSLPKLPQNVSDDVLELNRDLERMRDDAENMAVQLTRMAYDMVVLRTSPELAASMQKLDKVYQRCRAAVCGDKDQEPKMGKRPDPTSATQTDSDMK